MLEDKRVQFTAPNIVTGPTTSISTTVAVSGGLLPPQTSGSGGGGGMVSIASGHAIGSASGSKLNTDFLPQVAKVLEKNSDSSKPTIRLKIELFPSDSAKYPEYNYAHLLRLEKKKLKKQKQKTFFDEGCMDVDNDDDVARIAREMERKYGSAYSGSGSRSKKKMDTYDIGMGYDDNDSFIDNTEAYDEIIPNELETVEGGFYINCGPLTYKKLYNESMNTKTDEIIKMPDRPKKVIISSSSEEDLSSSAADDDDDDDDDDNNDNENDENEEDDDDEEEDEDDDDDDEDDSSDDKNGKNDCSTDNEIEKENTAGTAVAPTPMLTAPTMVTTTIESTTITSTSITQTSISPSSALAITGSKIMINTNDVSSKRKLSPMENHMGAKRGKKHKSSSSATEDNVARVITTHSEDYSSINSHHLTSMEATLTNVVSTSSNIIDKERFLKKNEKTTTVKDMLKIQRDNFLKSQNTTITPIPIATTAATKTTTTMTPMSISTSNATLTASNIMVTIPDLSITASKPPANTLKVDTSKPYEKLAIRDKDKDKDIEKGEKERAKTPVIINLDDIPMQADGFKQLQQQLCPMETNNNTGSGNGVFDVNDESDSSSSTQSTTKQTTTNIVSSMNNNQLEDIGGTDKLRSKDTELPVLDATLLNCISNFRNYFQQNNLIGKKFKFSDKLVSELLTIDGLLEGINNKTHRTSVFAHLEYQLQLPKYSLLRKVKQVHIKDEKSKQADAFYQLHKGVSDIMPQAIKKYEAEKVKYNESQDSAKKGGGKQASNSGLSRKFPWNNELRSLLFELYKIRCNSHKFLATRNETQEDYVCNYIRLKILPIWPEGWMTYDELRSEIDHYKNGLQLDKQQLPNLINHNNNNQCNNVVNYESLKMNINMNNAFNLKANNDNFNATRATATAPTTLTAGTITLSSAGTTSFPLATISSIPAGQNVSTQLISAASNYQSKQQNLKNDDLTIVRTGPATNAKNIADYATHSIPTAIMQQQFNSALEQQLQKISNKAFNYNNNNNSISNNSNTYKNFNARPSTMNCSNANSAIPQMDNNVLCNADSLKKQMDIALNCGNNPLNTKGLVQKIINNNKCQQSMSVTPTTTTTTSLISNHDGNKVDPEVEIINITYPAVTSGSATETGYNYMRSMSTTAQQQQRQQRK